MEWYLVFNVSMAIIWIYLLIFVIIVKYYIRILRLVGCNLIKMIIGNMRFNHFMLTFFQVRFNFYYLMIILLIIIKFYNAMMVITSARMIARNLKTRIAINLMLIILITVIVFSVIPQIMTMKLILTLITNVRYALILVPIASKVHKIK